MPGTTITATHSSFRPGLRHILSQGPTIVSSRQGGSAMVEFLMLLGFIYIALSEL
jgi:hypothetical protein